MGNFIATLILIGITFFILNLFPFFQEWTSGFRDDINEKTTNVVEEYERVKGKVDDITESVVETKEKVEDTLDTVGRAVDAAGNIIDKVDDVLGNDETDEETELGEATEDSTEEATPAEEDPVE